MKTYLLAGIFAASLLHTADTQATFKDKIAIMKHRYTIAKNILRYPVGVACSMAPIVAFAHYAPVLVAGMGPIAGLSIVGIGALYAGAMSAEISTIFNKS